MQSIVLLGLMSLLSASTPATDTEPQPAWLEAKIQHYQAAALTNPPRSVTRYRYRDATVYYVPAKCCDQMRELFDDRGQALCAPDGGFTGRGDGRCADFRTTKGEAQLIWRDSRVRKSLTP